MRDRILDIILAYTSGNATPSEKEELENWVNASEANKNQFRNYLRFCDRIHLVQHVDKAPLKLIKTAPPRQYKWWIGTAAASILVALWLGYQHYRSPYTSPNIVQTSASPQIHPGDTKAYLQVDNRRITLDQNNTLDWSNNLSVLNQEGETVYHSSLSQTKPQTLVVPRGSEFDFTLADGTHVWLNSESSITFPSQFEKDKRTITIQGEAYLEVSKDKNRPFNVALSQGNVQVLGTRFSVYDRPKEELYAVLVEGSIAYIDKDSKQHIVKPSEKITLNRENEKITIRKTDTNRYTSWTKKVYVFEDQQLGDIMLTLSRWYDFDFYFEKESLKAHRFSGRLKRNQSLINLLKSYEAIADIQFKIEGKKIYIQPKIKN